MRAFAAKRKRACGVRDYALYTSSIISKPFFREALFHPRAVRRAVLCGGQLLFVGGLEFLRVLEHLSRVASRDDDYAVGVGEDYVSGVDGYAAA